MSTSLSVRRQNMAAGRALRQAEGEMPALTGLQQRGVESARRLVDKFQLGGVDDEDSGPE